MSAKSALDAALRLLVSVSLLLSMFHASIAVAATQGDPIEGSWAQTDTRVNGIFTTLLTFSRNFDVPTPHLGEATATSVDPAIQLQPGGHGSWAQAGDHQYSISLWFVDVTGTYVIARIRETLKVSDDDNTYSGTFQTQILDAQGGVLQVLHGTVAGCRIPAPSPTVSTGSNCDLPCAKQKC